MKQIGISICLLVYLFGATDAYQVLKAPLLVIHYIKHKQENPYTTVLSFLQIHYEQPQPFDADYNQDMQLPFKKLAEFLCTSAPTIVPASVRITINPPAADARTFMVLNDKVPVFRVPRTIFQPPRA